MSRHPSKLIFLDGLRGLAALYVMIGHARWLLWEGFTDGYKAHPERYGLAAKMLTYGAGVFRWGHEAVLFFFVLSGFVIHLRYARNLVEHGETRFAFGSYLGRRARRLYPPLILALLLTWCLDLVGRRLHLPAVEGTTLYPLINQNIGHNHTVWTALRNLAFIMTPVFGSDGPLWSLNYEAYFYLLYPLLLPLAGRSSLAATFAVIALSALGFVPGWPASLFWLRGVCQLMIVWWFGALLAERFCGRRNTSYRALGSLVLAFGLLRFLHGSGALSDIAAGIGFSGVISLCLARQEQSRSLAALEKLRALGAMSYTLYVIHFPILVFMSGCLLNANGGLLPEGPFWATVGIAISLVAAWFAHLAVERPFTSRGSVSERSAVPNALAL
jgi:peptidoglycan/LPS O-acetylase OafA/YrhL